jgi:dethiobiotin synthetase
MSKIFIAGINTDVGKTYITGLLAKSISLNNKSIITHKIAQTGCNSISKDIITHREIMGIPLNQYDKDGTTCPYIFEFPASPHLSANLENKEINIDKIIDSIKELENKFENIIIEGVGGILVPLTIDYTSLDFITNNKLPVILVSTPELGSINHTLLSLEIIKNKNIKLLGIVYNTFGYFPYEIKKDSINVFKDYIKKLSLNAKVIEIKDINQYNDIEIKNIFNEFEL